MSINENLLIFPAISLILIIEDLNPAIKSFFTNNFVLFVLFTLMFYRMSNNVVVSMAESFVSVIAVNIVTIKDPAKTVKEAFELIYPTTDSKLTCNEMTVKELLEHADNDEDKLKGMMIKAGVPGNIQVNDNNAPLIATYLQIC